MNASIPVSPTSLPKLVFSYIDFLLIPDRLASGWTFCSRQDPVLFWVLTDILNLSKLALVAALSLLKKMHGKAVISFQIFL